MKTLALISMIPILFTGFSALAVQYQIEENEYFKLRHQAAILEDINMVGSNGMIVEPLVDEKILKQLEEEAASSNGDENFIDMVLKRVALQKTSENNLPGIFENVGFVKRFTSATHNSGVCRITVQGKLRRAYLACKGKFLVSGQMQKLSFTAQFQKLNDAAMTFKTRKGTTFLVPLQNSTSGNAIEYAEEYETAERSVP